MNTLAEVESQVLEFSLEVQLQLLALLADNIRSKTVAMSPKRTFRQKLGGYEGKVWMAPDFDDALDCFAEYVQYLIDTHVLLWSLDSVETLSPEAKEILPIKPAHIDKLADHS